MLQGDFMRERNAGKALLPLVQLLPAAALGAAVLLTLPHTAPVLAEVPERLVLAAEAASEAEPEEVEEVVMPKLPYPDGVYTGSSRGYGGTVKVQLTMENGVITDLQILDASHETSAFLKRAKRLVNIVLDAQTWEVDAVSEATYTSRGILGAVKNALTGEVVNNPLPPQPKPAEPLVVEEFTKPSAYRDGVYTASAEGFGGPITVQVTILNDQIDHITIVSAPGETSSYFTKARHVISTILDEQTPEVDAISGATYSSTGILNAVKSALASAATEQPEDTTEAPAEETTAPDTSEADSAASDAEQPTVEVVQVEEKHGLFQRAKKIWQSFFLDKDDESAASSEEAAGSVVEAADADAASDTMPEEALPAESDSTEQTPEAADASSESTEETTE